LIVHHNINDVLFVHDSIINKCTLQGSYTIAEMEFQAISRFFPGFVRPLGYGLSLNKQAMVLDPTLVYYCVRQPLLMTFSSNSNDSASSTL